MDHTLTNGLSSLSVRDLDEIPTIPSDLIMLSTDSDEICEGEGGFCTLVRKKKQEEILPEPEEAKHADEERYRPAYELQDGSLERAGRALSVGLTSNVPS